MIKLSSIIIHLGHVYRGFLAPCPSLVLSWVLCHSSRACSDMTGPDCSFPSSLQSGRAATSEARCTSMPTSWWSFLYHHCSRPCRNTSRVSRYWYFWWSSNGTMPPCWPQPLLSEEELAETKRQAEEFGRPGGVGEWLQKKLQERAASRESWVREEVVCQTSSVSLPLFLDNKQKIFPSLPS